MKKSIIVAVILALFIELLIWFYLIYFILSSLSPDRLVWFLYWVYVPVTIFNTIIAKTGREE